MGNQPSAPQPVPPQPQAQPPPLPPVCDANCQRQKLLSGLKNTLDMKEQTKAQDPEGYEQARIAYFTALYGDGWLAKEKQRIANEEVSPKITSYTDQYDNLKKQKSSQQVFVNLMNAVQADQEGDERDLQFLKKQAQLEKDKAHVVNRLTDLGGQPSTSNYMLIILDVVLAILGIGILYLGYTKFYIIKGYLMPNNSVPVGGKRPSH